MADRLPQYPMMPNFSPALMQQQQQQTQQQQQLNQQQQQQQQPQDPHQSFTDIGHIWQQPQQIQYNRPPGAGGDMNQQQQNSQMMDILRNQNLARMQGMQHNQQQFSLNGQPLGDLATGLGNNQPHIQNQSFLDPGSGPSQPPGFPSGMSNPGMQQQQQQQPANRNAMLQALQANANSGHARQLEILLAQNQSGPVNLTQRLEHQRAVQQQAQQLPNMGQSPPAGLFASGVIDRRPSPGNPGSNLIAGGLNPQQQQQQQQQRKVSPVELTERIKALRNQIAVRERELNQLGSQRGLTSDAQTLSRMRLLSEDIKMRKDYSAKMVSALNNFTAMAQAQAQQAHGSGQPPWNYNAASQMAPGQPQNPPQAQINRPPGLTGAIPRPPSVQRSHPTGPLGAPGPGPSLPNQLSPNMNPQFPFPMGPASSPLTGPIGLQPSPSGTMQLPLPLEKSRFDNAYKSFCSNHGVKHDPRMMNYEGRDIDLFMLHTCVMQEGGIAKVATQDLWGVIGGRMGFVNFPGSEAEPARAGPGLAQRLAQVYRDYLESFDRVYITSVMESRRKAQIAQTQAAAAAAAAGHSNNVPNQNLRGALNGFQMQMVVNYAHQSVEELRRQGVQERIISFVESNRANLQRTAMEQGMFRGQLNQGIRSTEQHGTPVPGPPFHNGSHQNAPTQHPSFLPHQNGLPTPISGNNFVDNRQTTIPQPSHPNMQNGTLVTQPKNLGETLQRIKAESKTQFLRMQNTRVEVPVEQKAEFNTILNQLCGVAQEIESKLPTYLFVLKSEDFIKRLVLIMLTVLQQRSLLNGHSPRYITTLDGLRAMMRQVQIANDRMHGHLRQHMGSSQQTNIHSLGNNIPLNNLSVQEIARPPSSHPQQPVPPPSLVSANRSTMNLRPPGGVKKPSGSTPNAVSTPTPPSYSASTPVASASTPTASSPPAPKSPKGKTPVKPKSIPKRRSSVKNVQPPATEQTPTPPAAGGASKRQRDEVNNAAEASPDASGSGVINEPSPPKRPKTEGEWGGPIDDAAVKKAEVVENIKTEEDASAFLEQMTEFIKMAGEGQQEALSSDISETLDQILKGYGSAPDGPDVLHGFSSFGSLGESSQASTSKPHPDEFVEFFDFSSFTAADEENDTDSKAATPELSSTGPSPDSGSEADPAQHVLLSMEPPKTEELPDLLRLGPWKEIDGGESAYYHSADGWKWDSPMPTLEQPWAIFNS